MEGEEVSIQEVIRLQEEGFTVRIQAPGSETFDLEVLALVQFVHISYISSVIYPFSL